MLCIEIYTMFREMNNNPFHIHVPYWITIILLSGAVFFLWNKLDGKTKPVNTTMVVNHYDSTVHSIQVPIPQVVYKTVQVEVPAKVDTAKILSFYYEKNVYKRTISDSNITANITDTIFQNKLIGSLFDYKWKRPVSISNTTIEEKYKLFAGIEAGANKNGLATFAPELILLTNKDRLYSVNYNLENQSLNVGTAWKIRLKK